MRRGRRAGDGGSPAEPAVASSSTFSKSKVEMLLALAVFGDGEVFFFQVADEIAFFVAGDDVDEDEFGG